MDYQEVPPPHPTPTGRAMEGHAAGSAPPLPAHTIANKAADLLKRLQLQLNALEHVHVVHAQQHGAALELATQCVCGGGVCGVVWCGGGGGGADLCVRTLSSRPRAKTKCASKAH